MHIEGRKYEVTLPDGRIVSRQRANQLKNPEADKIRGNLYNATEKRKKYKAKWWQENKHRFKK